MVTGFVETSLEQRVEMSKVQSLRALALQSQDAIELLSSKWRITILHLLDRARSGTTSCSVALSECHQKC
jgi:DNA-binding HxlR family transcriptional regulator